MRVRPIGSMYRSWAPSHNKGSQNIEKTSRNGQPKPPECTTKEEARSDLDGNFDAFP